MRKIIIALLSVLILTITGCNNNIATNPITEEPKADGNTTITQEMLLFEAVSHEEFNSKIVTYFITSEGKVTKEYEDGTTERFSLKDEDVLTIHSLWEDFNTNNVEITEGLVFDYPSYKLIVYNEDGNETTFESNANSQCEKVEEVFGILWTY